MIQIQLLPFATGQLFLSQEGFIHRVTQRKLPRSTKIYYLAARVLKIIIITRLVRISIFKIQTTPLRLIMLIRQEMKNNLSATEIVRQNLGAGAYMMKLEMV